MNDNAGRFVCVLEPTGNWTVWDCHRDEPASLDGEALIGRERHRADAARDMLERIHRAQQRRAAREASNPNAGDHAKAGGAKGRFGR